jgi:methylated-DNA-[protein]-cysteine S-methyltransferase
MVMEPNTHVPKDNHVTFETALGRCGIAWSEAGVTRVWLPGARGLPGPDADASGVDRLPRFVRRAIEGMTALYAGTADDHRGVPAVDPRGDTVADLRNVPFDDREIDDFRRAVYAAARDIPPGSTRSYGEVARAIGRPDGARDVGVALARNPCPILVPCHRVVAANGALTGFSAPGGLETKRRMLELEGAPGYGQQLLFG